MNKGRNGENKTDPQRKVINKVRFLKLHLTDFDVIFSEPKALTFHVKNFSTFAVSERLLVLETK